MAYVPLTNTSDYQLVHDEQDIRGWEVRDPSDAKLGRVEKMLVNTDTEYVESIELNDGRKIPAKDIHIGDRVVYTKAVVGRDDVKPVVKVYNDYGRVVREERVAPGYDTHAETFRTHHRDTYGATGNDFDYYEPAYKYGYTSASHDTFRGRSYTDAENDLRTGYTERYPDHNYDDVSDAVRYSYERYDHAGTTNV